MQVIRLIVVAIAGVATAAGYFHEGRRLQAIQQLSGDKARQLYEAGRVRGERMMWVVAALLAVGAIASVVRQLMSASPGPTG